MSDDALLRYYRTMARNNAWSNHRLLAACAALSQEEFEAPRVSFFPSLTSTLNHILFVDRYYLDALAGRSRAFDESVPCVTVEALRAAQSASDRRLVAWCDELDAPGLNRPVLLVREQERVIEDRTDRVLAHLFVHQIHHRGQAHAMLAGTGVVPPQLDEFLLASDAALRSDDLVALGFNEDEIWRAG
jgi:uncharacterized damage-inducible protein DinB